MTFYIIAIWKLMTIIAIYLFFILYLILSALQIFSPKKLNDCKGWIGWIKCSWINLTKPYFVRYSTKNKDLKILSFYGTNQLNVLLSVLIWLKNNKENLTISSFFHIKLKIKNEKSCVIKSWEELELIIQDLLLILCSREWVIENINQHKLIKL